MNIRPPAPGGASTHALDVALEHRRLGVEDAGAGGADDGVVAQGDELEVEDAALVLAHAADADGVSPAEVAVEAGLGPVGLVEDLDGGGRGAVAAEGLGLADVGAQGVLDLLGAGGGAAGEAQADAGGVAVDDGDAGAGGADLEVGAVLEGGGVGGDGAEDLLGLGLELVLLALDEGDDVVDDVEGGDAGVAGAGDGLEGDDGDGLDGAEAGLEGGEGDDEADDGAVGVADEEALVEVVLGALVGDEVEVGEVDGRDDEGDEGVATVVFGVGEDGEVGLEELGLCQERGSVDVRVVRGRICREESWGRGTYQSRLPHPSPAR